MCIFPTAKRMCFVTDKAKIRVSSVKAVALRAMSSHVISLGSGVCRNSSPVSFMAAALLDFPLILEVLPRAQLFAAVA